MSSPEPSEDTLAWCQATIMELERKAMAEIEQIEDPIRRQQELNLLRVLRVLA